MRATLKRLNDGLARGEAAIATVVLLAMVLLAAGQALLYNLSTRFAMDWANDVLLSMDWTDGVLQQGTLWLAFLGASLATHDDKHIAIDALSRVLPKRARLSVRTLVAFATGAICFFLAQVFFAAARGAQERPLAYEALTDAGAVHVCDAPASALVDAALGRPDLFCGVRWAFEHLGVPAETPIGALQYIVPAMFLVIALRLVGRGVQGTLSLLGRGDDDGDATGETDDASLSDAKGAEG